MSKRDYPKTVIEQSRNDRGQFLILFGGRSLSEVEMTKAINLQFCYKSSFPKRLYPFPLPSSKLKRTSGVSNW